MPLYRYTLRFTAKTHVASHVSPGYFKLTASALSNVHFCYNTGCSISVTNSTSIKHFTTFMQSIATECLQADKRVNGNSKSVLIIISSSSNLVCIFVYPKNCQWKIKEMPSKKNFKNHRRREIEMITPQNVNKCYCFALYRCKVQHFTYEC